MWTRAELKSRAKTILRSTYWQAFVVSLVLLVSGSSEAGGPTINYHMGSQPSGNSGQIPPEWFMEILPFIISVGLFWLMAVIAFRVLLGYPLEVGVRRFFNEAAQDRPDFRSLGHAFKRGWYNNAVLTMLSRDVRILAWTLLLIIPGIVKFYAYRFVPYILADNPTIAPARAIALSNEMTSGQKMNIFILDLSFIGWYLLGVLALGVGTFFVHPYVNATAAELYAVLRHRVPGEELTAPDLILE